MIVCRETQVSLWLTRGQQGTKTGQGWGRDRSPFPFQLLTPTAGVNIIPWNLCHRSDPASLWSPHSTYTISMKRKFQGMDIIVNPILSACLPSFPPLPYKLILYIFDFEVAKREAFQNTLGTPGFNQYASALRKYVGSRKGFDVLSAVSELKYSKRIFLYRRTSQTSSHWSSHNLKCSMNSPLRCSIHFWKTQFAAQQCGLAFAA